MGKRRSRQVSDGAWRLINGYEWEPGLMEEGIYIPAHLIGYSDPVGFSRVLKEICTEIVATWEFDEWELKTRGELAALSRSSSEALIAESRHRRCRRTSSRRRRGRSGR